MTQYGHTRYDATPTRVQRLIWRYIPRGSLIAEIIEASIGVIASGILVAVIVAVLALMS
jgi:hypothetical protein